MIADVDQLANILEAAMLVAGKPMPYSQLESLFEHETEKPTRDEIKVALEQLQAAYENKGIELVEVASGFRLQAKQSMAPWITHLYQEKSPRYSRALMETLVLIAYRQPITRGEIEDVRGVAVSTNIIKTLLEREWVRVLGHRDVPGRPAILGTTRQFLDYFNLKRIDELPTLSEIKDLDQIDPELAKEVALLESQAAQSAVETDSESESDEESSDEADSDASESNAASDAGVNLSAESDDQVAELTEQDLPASDASGGNSSDDVEDQTDQADSESVFEAVGETSAGIEPEDVTADIDLFLGDEDGEDEQSDHVSAPIDSELNKSDSEISSEMDESKLDDSEIDTSLEPRSLSDVGSEVGESETLH